MEPKKVGRHSLCSLILAREELHILAKKKSDMQM